MIKSNLTGKRCCLARTAHFKPIYTTQIFFYTLHDKVAPLVKRRYRYKDESQPTRLFQGTPKKWEEKEKLIQKMSFFLPF